MKYDLKSMDSHSTPFGVVCKQANVTAWGIHRLANYLSNSGMTTPAEARRSKLRQYIDEHCDGNAAELARRVKKAESQINDMLANRKSFGEKVARSMEKELKLPPYWFDGDKSEVVSLVGLSKEAKDHILWIIERDKAINKK